MKYKVIFDEDRCKGCGICPTVCPVKIIEMSEDRINSKGFHPATVTNMDKCIGCTNCATMCPDYVITIEKEE